MPSLRAAMPLSLLLTTVLFVGCEAFLPKRSVPPEGPLPESFSQAGNEPAQSNRWWQEFGSDELEALVQEAMDENLTLRQLWARLDQAGSLTVQAASLLYPQLDITGDSSYRRTVVKPEEVRGRSVGSALRSAVVNGFSRGLRSAAGQGQGLTGTSFSLGAGSVADGGSPSRIETETKQFGLALAASYEFDIWGRIASGYRASQYDLEATRFDLESSAMTLAAEVVDRWLQIIEQRELRRILDEQLATSKTYLELVELRFRKAQVSALDVYQQRQAVADVERQIPLVEARERVLRHELALLLGKPAAAELELGSYDLTQVPPLPATGIPAELLLRRPDIRAALADLRAADWRVASARADRLPAIRLTGGIGYGTGEITHFFDDWFLSLAGSLTQPLFDGFQREAEVDRTLAVVDERLAGYRLVVLSAVREVEDALIQERKQREYIEALEAQLEAAGNSLREASQRYQKGLNDYLPVLTALASTHALARNLVTARRDLLIFRVNLYRALGGTWTQELEPPGPLYRTEGLSKAVSE